MGASNNQPLLSVRGTTRVVGVFGWPVAHSLSPPMHNAAFAALAMDWIYLPFPVRPEDLGRAVQSLSALGIVGVNLTIPHKERVLPFLDEITEEARLIGAVNTVHCVEGRLIGDNTDGRGFYEPLRVSGIPVHGQSVVVFGAGGAARAVVFQLVRQGARVLLVNRTRERAERLAQDVYRAGFPGECVRVIALEDTGALVRAIHNAMLLVHTTRAGMHPDSDALPPIPLEALHRDLLVYDLVYNPMDTRLLQEARRRGCAVLTGVQMLVYQGAIAFQRWTGQWPPTPIMEQTVLQMLGQPMSGQEEEGGSAAAR
ncbi:MAG: shikimate dehydrogenase [Chloroherpetonaceae bacterium]|nr:shikimate dehydrogenase [Chthonomonadaceae bacterium]MDW8207959.1 shikimate dehydrogenase [Chloroherpetonaceae bacterium]